jgi:hypothetical protein
MIYTVTLNPALDRFIVVEQLLTEDTTRILSETAYAAGKGINVSRVIRELGGHIVALGLVGGYEGLQLEGLLINAGVMSDFTRISGETRTNIILREQTKGRQYVIGAASPEVNATEIGIFYQNFNQIQNMEYLILSGSLPRGATPTLQLKYWIFPNLVSLPDQLYPVLPVGLCWAFWADPHKHRHLTSALRPENDCEYHSAKNKGCLYHRTGQRHTADHSGIDLKRYADRPLEFFSWDTQ